MRKLSFATITFLILSLCVYQVSAYQSSTSLGSVAGNVYSTTSIVARLMWAACVIAGIALIITAITQIQVHRQNPKLMPLTTPVTYLLLGLSALAIPFADRILGLEDGNLDDSPGIVEPESQPHQQSRKVKKKQHKPRSVNRSTDSAPANTGITNATVNVGTGNTGVNNSSVSSAPGNYRQP